MKEGEEEEAEATLTSKKKVNMSLTSAGEDNRVRPLTSVKIQLPPKHL